MTSRKHIPWGCISHYIHDMSEESKSLYEAYKKQYMSNPFDSTTLDTGNELMRKMAAENKRWKEMITSTDLTGNSRKEWQTIRKRLQTTQHTRGVAVTEVWQTLCKLCRPLPPPAMEDRLPFLGKPAMRTHWMAVNSPHKGGRCRD